MENCPHHTTATTYNNVVIIDTTKNGESEELEVITDQAEPIRIECDICNQLLWER